MNQSWGEIILKGMLKVFLENELFKWSIKDKQMMNTLRIMTGKDVSFDDDKLREILF